MEHWLLCLDTEKPKSIIDVTHTLCFIKPFTLKKTGLQLHLASAMPFPVLVCKRATYSRDQ